PATVPSSTPHPGRKTLVVFGDSHADMWIRPLLVMAKNDHWDIVPMWKSACTPENLYAHVSTLGNVPECHAWYRWAVRTTARLHPNAMFISFLDLYDGTVATKAERGIGSLLAWGKKVTKHTVLMLDSPYLNSLPLPVDCLQESGATLKTCTGEWGGGPY